jgi:uncharacterized protein
VATIINGSFEWDGTKAESNLAKHGVSFEEAATVFEDASHALVDDGGTGYLLIGFSIRGRLLTVVHIERGERERIISAWRATDAETRLYKEG